MLTQRGMVILMVTNCFFNWLLLGLETVRIWEISKQFLLWQNFVLCVREYHSWSQTEHGVEMGKSYLKSTRFVQFWPLFRTNSDTTALCISTLCDQECQIWHPNRVRLALNGTNLGLIKISFGTFWLGKSDQFDLIWMPHLISLHSWRKLCL